ncbi:MAG: hypothetical protein KDA81_19785 [Planctomycetaceae bacterium]|nr:hypothetical protein [Planctomycetaceae bacterium]
MKLSIKSITKVVSAVVAMACCQTGFAQTTDSQVFRVRVPSVLSITSPADALVDTTSDQTDGNKVFVPAGNWSVRCNAAAGATVNLTAQSPFINGTSKRDARLDLAVASGAPTWAVSTATAQTDYAGSVSTATVQAASSKPGAGALTLTVTFINTTYSDLTQGDYVMTVQGTIAAN